jgi:hypothetical protein
MFNLYSFYDLNYILLLNNHDKGGSYEGGGKGREINKYNNSRFVVLWRIGEMALRERKKKRICAAGVFSTLALLKASFSYRTPSLLPSPKSCLDPLG